MNTEVNIPSAEIPELSRKLCLKPGIGNNIYIWLFHLLPGLFSDLNWDVDVAQLAGRWTSMQLMQVQFPGAARDFSP